MLCPEQTERDCDHAFIDARRYKADSLRIEGEIARIDARHGSDLQQSETAKMMSSPDSGATFLVVSTR